MVAEALGVTVSKSGFENNGFKRKFKIIIEIIRKLN